jgi:hypothetical protein
MPKSMYILISIYVHYIDINSCWNFPCCNHLCQQMSFIVHGSIKGVKTFFIINTVDMRGYDFYHGQSSFSHLP